VIEHVHVAAPDDPRLSLYRRVGDPDWLRDQRLFVAEGRLVVLRLLDANRFDVVSIAVTPAAHASFGDRLDSVTAPVYVCDQRTLNGVTGFNFHRGCLAIATRPTSPALTAFAAASRLLALEGVGNPDNVGGLFRTAAAFGVDGILLDPRSGDPLYRKAIRTSMGAALSLPWLRLPSWPSDLSWFRSRGFRLVALTPRSDATPIHAFSAPAGARLLVLVGSEGEGLSGAALAAADERIRIPIASGVDSLNVIVAAGVMLAAVDRPCSQS
jgi:tRNA G18 (ribose-2'-O)-methylase SpoU